MQEPPGAEVVVVVRLAGSRYALAMSSVAEVGRPPGLTRVPGLPTWVAGLANWRGRVLAVLDLRPLLGGSAEAALADAASLADRRARLVVLQQGGVRVGLLTGAVDGTITIDPDRLEATPAHLPGQAAALLAGQATHDEDGPLAVLDPAAILALSAGLPRTRRAG